MTTVAESVKAIAQRCGWPERAALAAAVRFKNEREAREVCGIPAAATVREEHLCAVLFDTGVSHEQLVTEVKALVEKSPKATLNASSRIVYARRREVAAC